jgi:hypothetical protein
VEIPHWSKQLGCGYLRFPQAIYGIQCGNACKQRKIGKREKSLKELSDPESLDGSPTDSETGLK